MVFSSHIFLFYYLPLFLVLYFGLVALKVNLSWLNLLITVASYVFYGWFEPWFVVLMLVSTLLDYICGRQISRPGATKRRRNIALMVSMVGNLGMLGYFKYYMFVMGGINHLAELFGAGSNLFHIMSVTLPIGISFYTFQTMSYTIDVWRGDAPPVKDMRTFSCFVALFPQLVAGPIVRYNTVAEQLDNRRHTLDMFTRGTALFMLGFAKKIILANSAGQVADAAFAADVPGMAVAWWGILAYSFQIYFDFCAYSDMAVGLGRMLGFEFIKNFDAPYKSASISEFWNRWHISLSTWIKDYIYISLGGNRLGSRRTAINLALAMFLSGVWHGAQWTFIVWGSLHAIFLLWERFMGRRPLYHKLPLLPKIVLTNIIVLFIWVTFRAPSMSQAVNYWANMVGLVKPLASTALLQAELFSPRHTIEMALAALLVWQPIQAHEWVERLSAYRLAVATMVFGVAIIMMFTQSFNPFLYFQF
jgi:alginate O-acetyltransferase complex protein AlgI